MTYSKIESWTHYNEWGEITHNAVLKSGQRELDMVKRYATHDYDSVLNMYYAKARFYDAGDRRFTAIDPILDGSKYDIIDYVKNPVQLVQYLYVLNNPIIYIDIDGLRYVEDDTDLVGAYLKRQKEIETEKFLDYWRNQQDHSKMFLEGIVSSGTAPIQRFDLYKPKDYIEKIKKCEENFISDEGTVNLIPGEIDWNDPAYFLIVNTAEEHAGIFPEGFDKLTPQQQAVALKTYGEYFKHNEIAKQVYIQAGINLIFIGLDLYSARSTAVNSGNAVFGKNTVGAAEKYVPKNVKLVTSNYLKKQGIDAHTLKTDFIGKKNIAYYDIYVDKDTGMLWLFKKGGIGEPMPLYEYIK